MSESESEIRDYFCEIKARENDKTNKSDLGEVFTPTTMIDEIFSEFPQAVWKNPNLKWLDTSCGLGQFPAILYFTLMSGLKSAIKNDRQRSAHILKNMIYMVEFNKESVKQCVSLFRRINPKCEINIHNGDFLKFNTTTHIGGWPTQFDCIVGNPPYNIGGTGLSGQKRTHIAFTKHSLQMLSSRGFLSFICPPSYRETNTPMNQLFRDANGHFCYIRVYGAEETFKIFHIQGRVDAFIFQKGVNTGKTVFVDEYLNKTFVNIDLDCHIPNFGLTIFQKLYKLVKAHGHAEAYRTSDLSTSNISTLCKKGGPQKVLHLIIKEGRRIFKTAKRQDIAATPKLLLNGLGVPYIFYDKEGKYAVSQSPVVVLRPNAALVKFAISPLFTFVCWGLRLTGNNNLPYLFSAIPNGVDSIPLTAAERSFIEENFQPPRFEDADILMDCGKAKTVTDPEKQTTKTKTKRRKDKTVGKTQRRKNK
jgi:hypothetical protein